MKGSVVTEDDVRSNAGRLDDQCFTFPMTNRMSERSRCRIGWSLGHPYRLFDEHPIPHI